MRHLKSLISKRTKAIVVVHYAGVACEMDEIFEIATTNNIYLVEDAAQAIDAYYKGRPLGSIGHLAAFSFHETKNVISGEGGMLVVNDEKFLQRSEIIWEKGTNRSAFFRGEVAKYNWIDVGSSFLPSEITAAFLYAQLEEIQNIQKKRRYIWDIYYNKLKHLENIGVMVPDIPPFCKHNAHLFYLVCRNPEERSELLNYLNANGVNAIFHYLSLHKSPFFSPKYTGDELRQSDRYDATLLRLPLYIELSEEQAEYVVDVVTRFFIENAQ